jgi:hypothetical protein
MTSDDGIDIVGAVPLMPSPRERTEPLGVIDVVPGPGTTDREQAEEKAAEREQRKADEEWQRQQETFATRQPKIPVTFAQISGMREGLSLRGALEVLERLGGAVHPGEHGTLRFLVPERFDASPLTDAKLRRQALDAVRTLDACRELVHHLLSARRALPDKLPAGGGGVVA